MRFFIDTANIEEIREASSWGILDGVTTNPTLCAKEGREFRSSIKEIADIVDGPISAEAISMERDGIVEEARKIASIAPNIVVKIPITEEGLAATKKLSSEGIKVNMTLIFSVNQALLAAKVGAAFVSPFLGRLDDIGHDSIAILYDMVVVYQNYDFDTKIIAASIRHPLHVTKAAEAGADIATVPFSILQQIVTHPLTDKGIDRFLKDWDKIKNL